MNPVDPNIPELELRIYAKDQPEYIPLPARVDSHGMAITCWQLSWRERILLFLNGRLFLSILTFNRPPATDSMFH